MFRLKQFPGSLNWKTRCNLFKCHMCSLFEPAHGSLLFRNKFMQMSEQNRFDPLKEHSQSESALTTGVGVLDANRGLFCLVSAKIERTTYAWTAQVLVVTFTGWWIRWGGQKNVWKMIGYFSGVACTFTQDKPRWIQGQKMQCAVQCHHNHDKLLGTYRDRLTGEEMGCLTDSQWAAWIFPDYKNSCHQD